MSRSGLPSYRDPPVIEVAASVQFDPVPELDVVRLVQLWERFQDKYPRVEQKPPLDQSIEKLGTRRPLNQVQLQLVEENVPPRLWFVSGEGNDLLQVQNGRFVRNWRRVKRSGEIYPRYEDYVRPRFLADYHQFVGFLNESGIRDLAVNQCELTYVNDIQPNGAWKKHSDVHQVFTCLSPQVSDDCGDPVDTVSFHIAKLLKDDEGQFLGRLHIDVKSVYRTIEGEEECPIFRLTMVARGRPLSADIPGVMGFLDLGRAAIVRNFDKITSSTLHQEWGKVE